MSLRVIKRSFSQTEKENETAKYWKIDLEKNLKAQKEHNSCQC